MGGVIQVQERIKNALEKTVATKCDAARAGISTAGNALEHAFSQHIGVLKFAPHELEGVAQTEAIVAPHDSRCSRG